MIYLAQFFLELEIFQTQVVDFDVLLTVHLSIFILVINQLEAQNLFISCRPVHRLRADYLNLCTGRPPIGVTIPEAV